MSINSQTQSAFVTWLVALPAEIRDAIYLELWRSYGLRHHIVSHGEEEGHFFFGSWPCTTEYDVDDALQRKIEKVRCRLGVPLGEAMGSYAQKIVTPPAFLKYARTLELSLSPDFPIYLACAGPDVSRDLRHEVYDFHWLRLDLFQNLQSLNTWISARAFTHCLSDADQTHPFTGITELDTDALEQALSHLRRVPRVTLSTPLAPSVGPKEEGFVEGVKTRVYKRGEGDRFHPPHYWTWNHFDSVIEISIVRYVRRLASVL